MFLETTFKIKKCESGNDQEHKLNRLFISENLFFNPHTHKKLLYSLAMNRCTREIETVMTMLGAKKMNFISFFILNIH